MSLNDIAADIPATTEEQHEDHNRIYDSDSEELERRSMDEYAGGWSPDH